MNQLQLRQAIARLEDLILAKALDDPEYPALQARLCAEMEALLVAERRLELDASIEQALRPIQSNWCLLSVFDPTATRVITILP
jgi:hypothetical protein